MANQKVTYITYNSGLSAKHLHLGNLVHNPKHPESFDPYEETTFTDIDGDAPHWANVTPLSNYALTLGRGAAEGDDDSGDESEGPRYRVVAAEKSTRIEIKDPKLFFLKQTLASPTSKKWLHAHLSAAEHFPKAPKPEFWLCTGLILMKHATWTSLTPAASQASKFVPGLQAPFDPTGVTAIRRSSVSEHIRPTFGFQGESKEGTEVGGNIIHETGKFPGLRGWAARWERVEIAVKDAGEGGGEHHDNGMKLVLLKGASKIAHLRLAEGGYARADEEEDDEDVDEDSGYWKPYLDVVDEYA
ncbi:hypothetical protein BGZ60DRAFT_400397 [Tricladium varicosporioides]|nr:hypothetical protein BGZ60DRAFT_400397 [Hymenoscyphus varicosporioides]